AIRISRRAAAATCSRDTSVVSLPSRLYKKGRQKRSNTLSGNTAPPPTSLNRVNRTGPSRNSLMSLARCFQGRGRPGDRGSGEPRSAKFSSYGSTPLLSSGDDSGFGQADAALSPFSWGGDFSSGRHVRAGRR